MDPAILIWLGIVFCIAQSAMFSGLNLAFFSLTRLPLEVESENGSRAARRKRDSGRRSWTRATSRPGRSATARSW